MDLLTYIHPGQLATLLNVHGRGVTRTAKPTFERLLNFPSQGSHASQADSELLTSLSSYILHRFPRLNHISKQQSNGST
jgi:hypothetical protein